jgi:hypothetical protein
LPAQTWDNTIITVLLTILKLKLVWDNATVSIFVAQLDRNIGAMADNAKLSQLLLLLVTNHGEKITDILHVIRRITEKSEIFLKRNILKRLESLEHKFVV